jgi:hypothetical protein
MEKKNKCKYDLAWIGPCGKPCDGDFCEKHEHGKCCVCKERPATRECDFASSLVCGAPLCDTCEHNHSSKSIYN